MVRVIIYCEGPTEEMFVNELMVGYFAPKGIYITASQCGSGGVSKYSIIKRDITKWCRQDNNWYVTTMLDYYGLPSDTPGLESYIPDIIGKVEYVEKCIYDDIKESNFIPNLIVHEFEALLFSEVTAFDRFNDDRLVKELETIRKEYENPECIDGGYDTTPSHRLKKLIKFYSKPIYGKSIARKIGIEKMRAECPHFNEWLEKIERL